MAASEGGDDARKGNVPVSGCQPKQTACPCRAVAAQLTHTQHGRWHGTQTLLLPLRDGCWQAACVRRPHPGFMLEGLAGRLRSGVRLSNAPPHQCCAAAPRSSLPLVAQDQSLSLCADLISKLSILSYEREYCLKHDAVPFDPAFFAAEIPGST